MKCIACGKTVVTAPYCCLCGAEQTEIFTLRQLFEEWAPYHYRRIGIKGRQSYDNAWKTLSPLQDRDIRTLGLADYQNAMDELRCYSLSLQQKLRQLISSLSNYAINIKKIEITNYAPYLILEGKRGESREIFSDEEILRLFFYAQKNEKWSRDAKIVLVLVFTGLRPNELFALKKTVVHFFQRYIETEGSKTEAGKNRIVTLPKVILPIMYSLYQEFPANEYLIGSPTGKKASLHNWRVRKFYPMMTELGINPPDNPTRIVPYSCRHTFASLSKRAGVDQDVLAKMIGHTDARLTERVYIHEKARDFLMQTSKVDELIESVIMKCDDSSHFGNMKLNGKRNGGICDEKHKSDCYCQSERWCGQNDYGCQSCSRACDA